MQCDSLAPIPEQLIPPVRALWCRDLARADTHARQCANDGVAAKLTRRALLELRVGVLASALQPRAVDRAAAVPGARHEKQPELKTIS